KLGDKNKDDGFKDSYFLGAPLPVGGKLYALNERDNGELRLVCIDPAKGQVIPPLQTLGTVQQPNRVGWDVTRRIHTVHLAYGEGILVCPTNAGQVLGVDLLARSLAWAYEYKESSPQGTQPAINPIPFRPVPNPNVQLPINMTHWKVAPPVV